MSKSNKAKKELSVVQPTNSALDFGGKFKIVRQVTLPTFKLQVGIPFAFRADGVIVQGKKLKTDTDSKREPASLLAVTNLDTGEVGQIVLGAVLKGNLEEQYPDQAYVGKSFAILKGEKREGKRYNEYQIMEIEQA